jgi:hypothetical protein
MRGILSLLRKAKGDYRNNAKAAYTHGLRILSIWGLVALVTVSTLTVEGIIPPLQAAQAFAYAGLMLFFDFALLSDIALFLRFAGPELFGLMGFSTLFAVVRGTGALSIAFRWWRS